MQTNSALDQSILKTLACFDLASFPVTSEELFVFLWQPPQVTYLEFVEYLATVHDPRWQTQGGYYFLAGRSECIAERQRHIVPTELMLKKARRAARCIAWLPFLKAILVCNSVGAETATMESDVDLLIITDPGRIWIVRFFAHSILRLLGMRTYGRKTAGRMCLCFFIDTDHLDLGPLRVVPDDIHFAYWLQQMFPLYDAADYAGRFRKANTWVVDYVPHQKAELRFPVTYTEKIKISWLGALAKKILEKMWGNNYGELIEREAKKVQWQSISPRIKELARVPNNHVVLREGILKFHEHDTRLAYRQQWLEKISYVIRETI
jgi:hypothetical protein